MQKILIVSSVALSLLGVAQANADECVFTTYHRWLPYAEVDFEETATGATFTIFNGAINKPVAVDLVRTSGTRQDTGETLSYLLGSATIQEQGIINDMEIMIHDQQKPSGNRVMSISSRTVQDNFTPHEVMIAGLLQCR